ncbi:MULTISPECIES: MATE family efflux transporter [Clostridium]|uniref:Multidrug export protein MepA n=1 Tax=Clostridium nitritogenes TaxID=83340 RepID=A0ABP3WUV5_9CLOT|nr:MATE family efflux transporter [Clostridium baratii]KJU70857.1 multidrug transporter MatE [Clostridium baratii]MBS6043297.1 MATE family efflux transporter [Clostridium baratii]
MRENFSKKQTYFEFIKYVLPSIVSMIFLSFYTTIDGFFVSRFVNSDALASINIVIPVTCVVFGISVMLATGSGALVGIKLGEKDKDGANKLFTFITLVLLVISIILTLIGLIFLKPLLVFLGTTESIMPYASVYGFVTVLMSLPMMFKLFFEYYARVDGNPTISLIMSSVGLILNVILDYLFIVIFKIGVLGAALGTFFSITVSAIIGLIYFLSNNSNLKFSKPKLYFKDLWNSCYNGSSEMFTEFSTGITTFLFNISILHYYGENGVAAMSIITYMYYFFIAIYFGITVGISPVISYNYGAKNKEKIKESLNHSFVSIGISSLLIFVISMFFGKYIISFFTSDIAVYEIATSGIKLFSFGFLMIGLNVFMSGYFTSIGNGQVSAIISISRSLVFVTLAILILPRFIDVNGIWLAIPVAELLTVFLSITFYLKSNLDIEDTDTMLENSTNV